LRAFQHWRGQNLAAVVGGAAAFHQGLASQVKLLEFKQRFGRALSLSMTPMRENVVASRRSFFASLPIASAKRRLDGN
jgi:hypothetical protein